MIRDALDWQPVAALEPLDFDWLQQAGVELKVLRLDLIDPLISGNKWFKLIGHLTQAVRVGATGAISLGGAHSNHLHALAAAGKRFGFPTVGLLRGHPQETPTVLDLQAFGMQLHWLGYAGYRERHAADFWLPWQASHPAFYPIPEGGGGLPGTVGCARLLSLVRSQLGQSGWDDYHGWWLAAGTGTTMAGLVIAEQGSHPVYGAMAVPDDHGVAQNVVTLAGDDKPGWQLLDASRGAFARTDPLLLEFMNRSEAHSGVPLEPIYTGKALLALHDEVLAGRFKPGTRLVFVHTGGLQGRRAMGLKPVPEPLA
ncbi:pyridoxal-phosphate dependent enzyme [Pseudomonas viridiflava]|uniref:1-aminocyclopropane-1-carboxylate deaminase/D-cysteine desulfhydrase n=1 Tax=Pseudomonas viridiflava TaxID=33069 RepID=UPI0018E5FFD1|nr:pyridoxal-phosphate dependent enzyme [Pseudomonas viridiflava]MBI6578076.1 pyridoxal-phosphate dependent enzyme [Pseudomonas viridiflava]MBI6607352.1 pyridoxal-phosphate dependent enzyme [Pseudomonas viridiflava]MBI6637919.1 pyridoxal-phosphate dependent enzyme [Pseudomonas viridiflava]MBI6867400.1 pyridoxal-phosphate dependent enzyme [Pseudomonas viridiflava]